MKEFADQWRPQAVLVEDKASGQSLIQELKRDTNLPIIPIKVDRDKITRAAARLLRSLLPFSAGRFKQYGIPVPQTFHANGASGDKVATVRKKQRGGIK